MKSFQVGSSLQQSAQILFDRHPDQIRDGRIGALEVSAATIERLGQRFGEDGLAACLQRRQTWAYTPLLDGA